MMDMNKEKDFVYLVTVVRTTLSMMFASQVSIDDDTCGLAVLL